MKTMLQVLSDDERAQVHERSLKVLATTGVRVDTRGGRQILGEAGAQVDEGTGIVRFPRRVVEAALQAAPAQFSLGGRRPGWSFELNAGECTLVADGGAVYTADGPTGARRPAGYDDWLSATRLIDSIEEIGVYWAMVQPTFNERSPGDYAAYWCATFGNFSRHVQDSVATPEQSRWLMEVVGTIFGDRETVRRKHPLSLLVCPSSPLVIEAGYTDAYLDTLGWEFPVAVMPMPLMGATAPASLISTVLLANCEVLAMLCLVQAAAPGTPFIYASSPNVIDPRSGRYTSGEVEHALLGAAVTEMGRFYRLPVQAPTGGSSAYTPGIQAGYERALNWSLPALSWPDLLVGPGLLGGAMILSLEQLLIDVEVFRRCRRLQQGIGSQAEEWLDEIIDRVGPGGNFLSQHSTRDAAHHGEWYVSKVGLREAYEHWEEAGKPGLLAELRQEVARRLEGYQAHAFEEGTQRELDRLVQRARQEKWRQ